MTFGHVAALKGGRRRPDPAASVVFLEDPPGGTARVCPFTVAVPFMAGRPSRRRS